MENLLSKVLREEDLGFEQISSFLPVTSSLN